MPRVIEKKDVNSWLQAAYGRFESSEEVAGALEPMLMWHETSGEIPPEGEMVIIKSVYRLYEGRLGMGDTWWVPGIPKELERAGTKWCFMPKDGYVD